MKKKVFEIGQEYSCSGLYGDEYKIKVVDIEYSHVAQEDMYMFSNGMYLTEYEVEMYLKKGVMKKW